VALLVTLLFYRRALSANDVANLFGLSQDLPESIRSEVTDVECVIRIRANLGTGRLRRGENEMEVRSVGLGSAPRC
jgi:hypothetical protein